MFASNTVFVLGAGASQEAGLPIGSVLKQQIAEKLFIDFDHGFIQTAGDKLIVDALVSYARSLGDDPNEYLRECRAISSGVQQAISIDNFLDTHQGNKKLELCGKVSIVRTILEAEAKSRLKFDEFRPEAFNPGNLKDT